MTRADGIAGPRPLRRARDAHGRRRQRPAAARAPLRCWITSSRAVVASTRSDRHQRQRDPNASQPVWAPGPRRTRIRATPGRWPAFSRPRLGQPSGRLAGHGFLWRAITPFIPCRTRPETGRGGDHRRPRDRHGLVGRANPSGGRSLARFAARGSEAFSLSEGDDRSVRRFASRHPSSKRRSTTCTSRAEHAIHSSTSTAPRISRRRSAF